MSGGTWQYEKAGDCLLGENPAAFRERVPDLFTISAGALCGECNRGKLDYYEPELSLLNPYADDPDDHLRFFGPAVFGKPESLRGMTTVSTIKLSRPALVERRSELLAQVNNLLFSYSQFVDASAKEFVRGEILALTAETSEYSLCVRSFLRHANFA